MKINNEHNSLPKSNGIAGALYKIEWANLIVRKVEREMKAANQRLSPQNKKLLKKELTEANTMTELSSCIDSFKFPALLSSPFRQHKKAVGAGE